MSRTLVIAIAGLVIVAGALSYFLFRGDADDPAEDAGITETEPSIVIPELTEIAADGEVLFDSNCAGCHGPNATGTDQGPPLVHIIYEPNHHADMSFVLAAQNGVRAHHWRFGNMPPQPQVDQDDVLQIVQYVRELQRANGIF